MKHLIRILVIIALTLSSATGLAEVIGTSDKEVRAIAGPILDNILVGFKTNDYATYSKDFGDFLKESISEKKFIETNRKIQDSIGNYQSREYLGFLQKGQMTLILWKGKFDKSADDILIKLVVSKRNGKYLVTGLWFQ